MCLETHVADETKTTTMQFLLELHLSSTVSLNFIIVFKEFLIFYFLVKTDKIQNGRHYKIYV
jgi:hypothetical protein